MNEYMANERYGMCSLSIAQRAMNIEMKILISYIWCSVPLYGHCE